jgi:hypothetical protein
VTKVIFRKWKKESGTVIAFFPEIPSDNMGYCCLSYEQLGQHGGADYTGCVPKTTPAKPSEYAELLIELKAVGYDDLVVVSRETCLIRSKRERSAKAVC